MFRPPLQGGVIAPASSYGDAAGDWNGRTEKDGLSKNGVEFAGLENDGVEQE